MPVSVRVFAALLAALSLLPAAVVRADDEEKPAAKSDKTAEKAPPTEVTSPGSVNGISYNAVVGTLTVGATDTQDAQLGADGKPLPGSQLANSEPKDPKDASPTARMSYVAYFKKDAKPEDRPDKQALSK